MEASQSLTKRSSDTALMPPPPPAKRIKRPTKILSEEEYTAGLSHVIARDYFPGLLENEAKQDYLDAMDAGDEEWLEEAGQRVKEVMTPGPGRRKGVGLTPRRQGLSELAERTPKNWVGGTPGTLSGGMTTSRGGNGGIAGGNEDNEQPRSNVETNMSLANFQAKYTSEDNESFYKIMDDQNRRRREKYSWMWAKNKLPSNRQAAQKMVEDRKENDRALAVPALFSARNTGGESTALVKMEDDSRLSEDLDDRPATVDFKADYKPRNGLLFYPDDVTDTHPGLETQVEAQDRATRVPPKGVNHASTRLPLTADGYFAEDEPDPSRPPSPTLSAVNAAIAGRPHPSLQKGGAYADSTAGDEPDVGATPRVNGYAYVDAEPTAAELQAVRGGSEQSLPSSTHKKKTDHDALLTSLVQSGDGGEDDDAGPNGFYIAEPSDREKLHQEMVAETKRKERAKNDRLKALSGREVPVTPRFTSGPRLGATPGGKTPAGLTPAARKMYARLNTTPAFGGEWTPRRERKVG